VLPREFDFADAERRIIADGPDRHTIEAVHASVHTRCSEAITNLWNAMSVCVAASNATLSAEMVADLWATESEPASAARPGMSFDEFLAESARLIDEQRSRRE